MQAFLNLFCLTFFLTAFSVQADEWQQLVDLRGSWAFNLGNNAEWASENYDDRNWDSIFVPAAWEDEGYPGYDGYAWYRISFALTRAEQEGYLYLHLGRVDDIDRVYLNGYYLGGTGERIHDFETAYNTFRVYRIPTSYLHSGKPNVLAVQVYDHHLEGGILEGRPGIYRRLDHPEMIADLNGLWDFRTGDDQSWSEPRISRAGWEALTVPGRWDYQGFSEYDGYAWYRTRVFVPASAQDGEILLVLGKIDDVDQAFWNGQLIGQTGDADRNGHMGVRGDEWQIDRAYPVPADLINYGEYNLIAIRVYDSMRHGGFFGEYVGLMAADQYDRPRQHSQKPKSFWEKWFNERE